MFRRRYSTYFLLIKNRPPVDQGHPRHVVNLLVDVSVDGTVLQPAVVKKNDTGVIEGQKRHKKQILILIYNIK